MNISQLKQIYGIANTLDFIELESGLPGIAISNRKAKAVISLHGGQVLSFQRVEDSHDLLFISDNAVYDGVKAIRGGVPICWPWFGPDPDGLNRQSHGFARNYTWGVVKTEACNEATTKIILQLKTTPETRQLWDYDFDLNLEITVNESLTLELVTRNTGINSFTITQALHAYFLVADINQVQVLGLEGHQYLDKLDNGKPKQQQAEITLQGEVDRIYSGVSKPLIIEDHINNRSIKVTIEGSETAIVWNPWQQNCVNISDLNQLDYQRFICVEAGNAATDSVSLAPGCEHRLLANYLIQNLRA